MPLGAQTGDEHFVAGMSLDFTSTAAVQLSMSQWLVLTVPCVIIYLFILLLILLIFLACHHRRTTLPPSPPPSPPLPPLPLPPPYLTPVLFLAMFR